jgi:hypothetical protein
MKVVLWGICLLYAIEINAQDTFFIEVHFLYGSKPKHTCRKTEDKWFGGMLGGHVGIGTDSGSIINFVPNGRFHLISHQHQKNSRFAIHSFTDFYEIMGGVCDSNKKMVIYIPVTAQQKMKFDSLKQAYTRTSPYDYAFFGMRCGAAVYDILAQIGVLPVLSKRQLIYKIFYPKKLRKRLIQYAASNKWKMKSASGCLCRKWESD